MVALQGDAEKLQDEAEQISLRLKEKAAEEVEGERDTIVTNGYFGEESTGESTGKISLLTNSSERNLRVR